MATTLTWLGHAAFRMDTEAGTRVYVDPFLKGSPTCPDAERDPERCDLLVVTHGHDDHVGDAVAIAQRFECPLVAQVELRGWLAGKGLPEDMSQAINKGGTVRVGDVRVTLTDASHSSSTFENGTFTYLGESCGLVLRPDDGPTIYLAGDTSVFGDMALIGRLYSPDVAILPIGDHFTMGPDQAALAAELVGARRVVPSHYATFPLLTGTPDALRPLLPAGVELLAPAPGETLTL
jgi:L-ascorbate metabolism protein UlaG (beta-lactamase superfamily)